MKMLEAKGVTIRFGGLVAINNVDLDLEQGEILAIIGPNGAGKTTLFNLLTGIYMPTAGTIKFRGEVINKLKPHQRVKKGISRTFQNIRLFHSLTVLENVIVGQGGWTKEGIFGGLFMSKSVKNERANALKKCLDILEFVGLENKLEEFATSLPYGEQRLLEIARALASESDLILLDEPAAGMNSIEKEKLKALINRIRTEMSKTILLIEHDMKVIMDISDRIVVLDHGEQIAQGKPEEIRTNHKVIEAYLGREENEDE
ncbi:ABC transporter ATP-binding protein [Petroclostridium sp. X23]|uniref:ABC transporter ATP-binding protein n=1 Tax=Petroclostridium sp. X23 TaxID=3045146 RepID=UPI0024ACA2A6|nr:ABC transporter ATP-binding protein [Petroclostridium sp. X23]WHH61476.1 ABC transporter ATP-binding protein [Petroclostridium sp. X23]